MDEPEERLAQKCVSAKSAGCACPATSGPQDCGLAYLVMTDPTLRAELSRQERTVAARATLTSERYEDRDRAAQPDHGITWWEAGESLA
jgi:hypothetical protein